MIQPYHRLTEFMTGEPVPESRTTRQKEQAKINGSKSSGPASAEGRAHSRLNAMRHGLVAKLLIPRHDHEEMDDFYLRVRRELMQEFSATAFTDRANIDSLAHDYVQLARARRTLEVTMQVPSLTKEEAEKWDRLMRTKKLVQLIPQANEHLAAGSAVPTQAAKELTACIIEHMKGVEETLEEDAQPDLEPLDAYQVQERAPMERMLKTVGAARPKFSDPAYVTGLLSGKKRPGKKTAARFHAVLEFTAAMVQRTMHGQREFAQQLEKARHTKLQELAVNPQQTAALYDYVTRIENRISRKIEQLHA